MSERGEVEVFMALDRAPNEIESRELIDTAWQEAKKLVAPTKGRVLGLSKIIRAEEPITGQLALKVRFAVEAPEHNFVARKEV